MKNLQYNFMRIVKCKFRYFSSKQVLNVFVLSQGRKSMCEARRVLIIFFESATMDF
jgi:hypothetical protein